MRMLNVHEAKTQLSSLLAEVEKGGASFLICRNGKPVAMLTPHQRPDRQKPHPVMSRIEINFDPTEPLDEEDWPEVS